MITFKFQIYDLLQLYVNQNKIKKKEKKKKRSGTVLFPNDLPVNALTHLCMNGFNFLRYNGLGNSEIARIDVFNFGPKTAKI